MNSLNSKEKNIITVDLTENEKIVFSQLGINPLLKLGKEYLTSNNFVRLNGNNEKEKTLNNKIKQAKKTKKISKSKDPIDIEIEPNIISDDKLKNKINEKEKVASLDKNDAIELNDEINNSRKTRRRSSAGIE